MALNLNDRVKETTTVTGTGTATLLGATTGFQSFAVIGNVNTTYYCIADQGGANWEVGIGTYTASGTTLARTTVLASSNAGALVVFTTGVKDVFVTYPSEKGVWYDASGNVLFTGTTTAANLAYTGTLTGSTGILNIGSGQVYKDASGNVGIGTTGLSGRLTIASTSTDTTNYYTGTRLSLQNLSATAGNFAEISFMSSVGNDYAAIWGICSSHTSGSTIGSLVFGTSNAGSAASEAMRIDSSGNVGIGTSSPGGDATNRSVTASGSGSASFNSICGTAVSIYAATSNNGLLGTSSNHPLVFNTNNTERMRIDSSGNVGIGTSVASASAAVKLNLTNSAATYLQFSSTSSSNGTAIGCISGAMQFFSYTGAIGSESYSEKMRIDSSGNVGIGTSSPNASAILDAQSTTKGVRFPNMTTTQKTAVATPAAGLVVFDTTLAKLCVYSGVAWQTITSI